MPKYTEKIKYSYPTKCSPQQGTVGNMMVLLS